MREDFLETLETRGFRIERDAVPRATVEELADALAVDASADASRTRGTSVFGIRNLLSTVPAVCRLAASPEIRALVEPVLGPRASAVRGIFFDKTAEANWRLGWHQDRAIAVKQRHDVPGFGPWSVKAGVLHVFPPAEVLAGMLTVRLHLDACDRTHGALRVLPESHRHGLLERDELKRLLARGEPVACEAGPGDALVMRPLLAHASGKCERPGHRRVVHLEFASRPLPSPLEWHESVGGRGPGPNHEMRDGSTRIDERSVESVTS